jgi:hypothetical protein
MISYKPSTVREQKIIDNINKPITDRQHYNSEWYITPEDKCYMIISSIVFTAIFIITALVSIP